MKRYQLNVKLLRQKELGYMSSLKVEAKLRELIFNNNKIIINSVHLISFYYNWLITFLKEIIKLQNSPLEKMTRTRRKIIHRRERNAHIHMKYHNSNMNIIKSTCRA